MSRDVSTPALSGFVLAIAAAGLLLGSRSAYVVALLSAVAAPTVFYFDLHFGAPPGPPGVSGPISVAISIVQASIFFAAAALVSIAVRHAERSRAQAGMSEARFRAIADNAPDMITEADAEGFFTYANPVALAASRLRTLDELNREHVGAWMHPDDRAAVVERFHDLAQRGGTTRAAFRSRDAKGRVSWLETTGARYVDPEGRTRVVSVTRDMTRQHEIEAALRESEARYRLLAEKAPDMIVEIDAAGRILYSNPRVLESLGFDPEELGAMQPFEYAHPDDRDACRRAFSEVMATGGPTRLVHRLLRKNGEPLWVASSGARHESASGELRLIAQSRDLTAELSLQEQLRESQKMDAIGRLAGGVAHDFNNLLTVIGGYASVLEGSLGPGSAAAAAHEIMDATERAAALTRQLLLLSRRQLAQPGAIDLNSAVRGLEPILRSILPEQIRLELALAPDVHAVEIDPSQLDQVLLNLALNARDAMPGSGCLRIATHKGQTGRFVHLNVSDTGQGMDEATRARAFEPFFTTKPAGAGTGLGLSTTYGIVRQAGGSIALESAPGRGTQVEISLPACAAKPAPVEAPRARAGRGRDAGRIDPARRGRRLRAPVARDPARERGLPRHGGGGRRRGAGDRRRVAAALRSPAQRLRHARAERRRALQRAARGLAGSARRADDRARRDPGLRRHRASARRRAARQAVHPRAAAARDHRDARVGLSARAVLRDPRSRRDRALAAPRPARARLRARGSRRRVLARHALVRRREWRSTRGGVSRAREARAADPVRDLARRRTRRCAVCSAGSGRRCPIGSSRRSGSASPRSSRSISRSTRTASSRRWRSMARRGSTFPSPPGSCELRVEHFEELRAFYAHDAYTDEERHGRFFEPYMLELGSFFGVREAGRLISVAGVHVVSARAGVAAVGGIATRPDRRGRGLARAVTARLCRALRERVDLVGLNVATANASAIRCYESLGFLPVCRYEEMELVRRPKR